MGKVVELSNYRRKAVTPSKDVFCIVLDPPVMVVRFYRDGVLVGEQTVVSEYMLREMMAGWQWED